MSVLNSLIYDLDERTIAQEVAIPHDEARMSYSIHSNTVNNFDAFSALLADYVQHHYARCISHGGSLSRSQAAGLAKEIIEREGRRRNADIVTAFNDAHDGTNNGLRGVLDIIAESLKHDAVERYIRDAFDRHITPNSWEQKVEIIHLFLQRFGHNFSPAIHLDQPERYAQNYQELIRSYTKALEETSRMFRRM